MRTICDVCESAPAVLFCAADEAALCQSCDHKVHMCNKLASRHVRLGLSEPREVPRCDICESAPAFFYCEIDGTSLCLQCDMIVHVGGKRTHGRYLLMRQRVEFPGDKLGNNEDLEMHPKEEENMKMRERPENHRVSAAAAPAIDANDNGDDAQGKIDSKMFDLNMSPHRTHSHGQTSNSQTQIGVRAAMAGPFRRDAEK